MSGGIVHKLLITGVSGLAWGLSGSGYAQSPADIQRGQAAEQTIEKTQEGELEELRKKAQRREQEKALDREKAADSLEDAAGTGVLSKLPSDENLAMLQRKIEEQPNNLDYYFSYGQMASHLGYYDRAAAIYEAMLLKSPNLDRVRLELGVAYLRMGRLEDAQRELQTVLERNPPEMVRQNIASILDQIGAELAEHEIDGTVAAGLNMDSNGNSAPDSGAILLFDTVSPLPAESRKQEDLQFFAAATVNHTYRPRWGRGKEISGWWKNTATVYQAEQSSLEDLDIKMLSLKTGPVFRSNISGIQFSPGISYNQIVLGTHTYLRNTSLDADLEVPVSERVMLTGGAQLEFREFDNAPGVTTYDDRTGSATQLSFGTRFIVSNEDYLTGEIFTRRERTREQYLDNRQLGANANYTHIFPYEIYSTASVSYRNTIYDGPDSLFSTQTRHDREKTLGLTLAKKLNDTLIATMGYQYRDSASNLLNYDYDNHRFSSSLSAKF